MGGEVGGANMSGAGGSLDLGGYLARIGVDSQPAATLPTVKALHLAHSTHIPFENIDILLGRPIRIDLASIQAKLIHARRGGYCFEQNLLFAAVLNSLGLPVTFLAARTRYRARRLLPRTHVLLLVEIDGVPWLADVGFGTVGLLEPVPLVAGQTFKQFGWSYCLVEEPGLWVLQTLQAGQWHDLYAFSLEPQFPPDLEMANYYVSTHPESRFVQTLVVRRSSTDERRLLRNFDFIIDRGGEQTTRALHGHDELLEALASHFDLHFPAGTRLRLPS
jgi:N-hydroxyarylamine O-acetyltransferase